MAPSSASGSGVLGDSGVTGRSGVAGGDGVGKRSWRRVGARLRWRCIWRFNLAAELFSSRVRGRGTSGGATAFSSPSEDSRRSGSSESPGSGGPRGKNAEGRKWCCNTTCGGSTCGGVSGRGFGTRGPRAARPRGRPIGTVPYRAPRALMYSTAPLETPLPPLPPRPGSASHS